DSAGRSGGRPDSAGRRRRALGVVARSIGIAPLKFWPICAGQQIGNGLLRRLALVEDTVDLRRDGHVDAELPTEIVGALRGPDALGDVAEAGENVGQGAPLAELE